MSVSRLETQQEIDYLAVLEPILQEVIIPSSVEIDERGQFPTQAMQALGQAGLLGLISDRRVGGMGQGHRAAALVVERIAQECATTAMVTCMHYAGTAVIEAFGPEPVRRAIAEGRHLTTLAFSEFGSRSHFWTPVSTAEVLDGRIRLNARKSFATSAGQVNSYVWSSCAIDQQEGVTLWLVPARTEGLTIPAPFNGLGLRGNHSSPVFAENALIEANTRLGEDGAGFDIMMQVVIPYFSLMIAAISIGISQAATQKAIEHVSKVRFAHLQQSLADLPTIRAYVARMRIKTDSTRSLLLDTLNALEEGRQDALLRLLEIKAAAAETSTEVTDLAMRVCGGAAFRKEFGLERCFRDARAATVMAPTTDVLFDFIGKAVCGQPLFA